MIKKIIFITLFPLIFYFPVSSMQVIDSRGQLFNLTEQEAELARQCEIIKVDREFWENKKPLDFSTILLPNVTQENFQNTISCIADKKTIQSFSLNDLIHSFWLADYLNAPKKVLREMAERLDSFKGQLEPEIFRILRPNIKLFFRLEPLTENQLKKSLVISYTDKEQTQPRCSLLRTKQKIKNVHGIRNLIEPHTQLFQQFVEQKLNANVKVSLEVDSFLTNYWQHDPLLYKNITQEFDRSWIVHIDLSKNFIKLFNLKKIIAAYPRLRSLDLSHNAIKKLTSKMFMGMPKIFYLNLSFNPVETVDDDVVATILDASRHSGFLKSGIFVIDLRGIHLSDKAFNSYKKLKSLQKEPFTLQDLGCTITKQGFAIMFFVLALYSSINQPCNDPSNCKALTTIFSFLTALIEGWAAYGPCDRYCNYLSNAQHILLD